MKRSILIIVPAVALIASLAVVWQIMTPKDHERIPVAGPDSSLIGGAFTLTSHTGKKVSDSDFRGKYMLVYFGYTFCPEICPTELQAMTEAIDLLGKSGEEVVPILISVDPERDTVEKLKEYVPLFHKTLVGLTGTPEEIAKAAKAYRVYYAKAGEGASYEMDHSAIIYLMDRKGKYATHFAYGVAPEKMAQKMKAIMAKAKG